MNRVAYTGPMKTLIATLLVSTAVAFTGCASFGGGGGSSSGGAGNNAVLSVSPSQPAAQGTADFAEGKNGNVTIDINVKHLADPQHLTPPASIYVVWLQRDANTPPQNIGGLKVDKDLTGSLQTVTALRSFSLFITAESNAQAGQPTGQKQLWTTYKQ